MGNKMYYERESIDYLLVTGICMILFLIAMAVVMITEPINSLAKNGDSGNTVNVEYCYECDFYQNGD